MSTTGGASTALNVTTAQFMHPRVLGSPVSLMRSGILGSVPAFIMLALLAALYPTSYFYNAALALRLLCLAKERLWCDHDYPRWGAHTTESTLATLPRARRTGFYHGVGASLVYLAPALRFAPPRCPKPSLALTPAVLELWPRTQMAGSGFQASGLARYLANRGGAMRCYKPRRTSQKS
jgi:hypothetical protein